MMEFNYDYVKKSMLTKTKEFCERSYFSERTLSIHEIANGTILPGKTKEGGGIFDDNKYYDQSYIFNAHPWAKVYPFDESELVYNDGVVLYLGMFHDVWGHCITDCLAQLWPLLTEDTPEYIRNAKWVYTTQRSAPLPASFFDLLRILKIDPEKLEYVSKPTKFQKIYLPDKSFYMDHDRARRVYTQEYKDTINRIISGIDPDESHSKIYFTRSSFASTRDFGEADVEKVFRDIGYHIVSPEKFSF